METKERILQKATEQFMRLGIRSVSMDDIAGLLGMSKKTIYQLFADKEELVDAVMQLEEQRMHHDCRSCATRSRDAVEEVFLTMEQVNEQFSQMNPVVVYDMEKYHPRVFQRFQHMKNDFLLGIIRDNINRGIREGLYRPELNVDVISKYRLESTMLPFNLTLFPPGRYNLAELSNELAEHFLYGLATLKGHKLIIKYKQQQK
ncbi:MAG TPA: TetR/AcrR family transcriptional regulator [Lacibacter sp.]|nr:TetR/AcrR family transcriptional regulator [Lacibacter sp.]HMO88186.1 TetR/AcrR family transcriptional regulator [Lacibacter sp.]HMP86211.1 TetR/AcrR family transcriptional regulator [Lacibacter sp.]